MLAAHGNIMAVREGLDQLDIRGEARAGKHPFQQVVTEQAVVWNPAPHRRLKGIDIIDPLAGERTLAKQVLPNIRDRCGVGVHAAGAGRCLLKQRRRMRRLERGHYPRLKNAVAGRDLAQPGINDGAVQGVCNLADQPRRRVARHPRVGIQCDDIAHITRHGQRLAVRHDEASIVSATQQAVQRMQLAAFALPPHPDTLSRVVVPGAMEMQEARPGRARQIAAVQGRDLLGGDGKQGVVPRHSSAGGIHPVGQQQERQITPGTGEMVNFQGRDLFAQIIGSGQQERHGNDSPQVRGHTVAQIEARQDGRSCNAENYSINQRHGHCSERQ